MCHSYHPPTFQRREDGPQSPVPDRVARLSRQREGSE